MHSEFYSHGKLLLSGEYLVLDGALSLAVPTVFGQSLIVEEITSAKIYWTSLSNTDAIWFEAVINLNTLLVEKSNSPEVSITLLKIITEAKKLNPNFLISGKGARVTTKLEFPQNWGLGSSSTLINNIAQWAAIDAFELLWNSFSGSGYDIACAQNSHAITYQLKNKKPLVQQVNFDPSFKNKLFFVHLNQKQNSREGIAQYRKYKENKTIALKRSTELTKAMLNSTVLSEFEILIDDHEALISSIIQLPKIKDQLFPDYFGCIKSLGAWGGDFVLVTGDETTASYFKNKGYETVIPYTEMVLK